MSNTLHEQFLMTDLNTIFMHFSPQDIEGFYQLYQLQSLRQKRAEIVAHMHELAQQIAANEARLKAISPSAIAQAALSQFRAIGVDDIDLLDSMLARGDTWLDHMLQLFEHCERLGMLQGNVTQWCTHALEGAYDWIDSMGNTQEKSDSNDNTIPATATHQSSLETEPRPETTEADFLQKLMSEDEEHAIPHTLPQTQATNNPTATTIPTESDSTATTIHNQTKDLQPTEPDTIPEHIDPPTQPIPPTEPPSHTEQKTASQTRKPLRIYNTKQKKKHQKQRSKRYHKT